MLEREFFNELLDMRLVNLPVESIDQSEILRGRVALLEVPLMLNVGSRWFAVRAALLCNGKKPGIYRTVRHQTVSDSV